YPGDVEPHPPVASQNEKRLLHVQRPTAVRHDEAQIGKVDGDVVELQRVAVLGAGAGKNARAGVDHHGQAALFATPIDLAQRGEPVDRKSTRLNSSHVSISYAVFCLKKKKKATRAATTWSHTRTRCCAISKWTCAGTPISGSRLRRRVACWWQTLRSPRCTWWSGYAA